MKFKAIIFDMDGTIVDTEILWLKASHIVIRKTRQIFNHARKRTD